MPGNHDAEDSGLSSSDRSDGFTQAVQEMQEAVSVSLRPTSHKPCKQPQMPAAPPPTNDMQLLAPQAAHGGQPPAKGKGGPDDAPGDAQKGRETSPQLAGGRMDQMRGAAVAVKPVAAHGNTGNAANPGTALPIDMTAGPRKRKGKAAPAQEKPKGSRATKVTGKTARAKTAKPRQGKKARNEGLAKGKPARGAAAQQTATMDGQVMADGGEAGGAEARKPQAAAAPPSGRRAKQAILESDDKQGPKRAKQTEAESDIELQFSEYEQQEVPLLPCEQVPAQEEDAQPDDQEEEQDEPQQGKAVDKALLTPIPDLPALQHLQSMATGAESLLQTAQRGLASLRFASHAC